MSRCRRTARARSGEAGFTLAVVLTIVTVVAVIVAFTLPKQWSLIAKREREIQTVWVMKQYARGIDEFQRAHNALPVSLEQLEKQTKPRVMRQMYPNPLSGEMDWILVPPTAPGRPAQTPGQKPKKDQDGSNNSGNQDSNDGEHNDSRNRRSRGTAGTPSSGSSRAPGPFVGVRPPQTGESIIALNGATSYEDWQFTVQDLQKEKPGGGKQQQPPKGTAPGGPKSGGN